LVWKPLQPNHAIERVRIVVQFGNELPAKFLRKLAADAEELRLKLGFTSKNLREGRQIIFGPVGVNVEEQPFELIGWDWQKLSPANFPIETLVLENRSLIFETAEYARWTNFIEKFEETALPSLSAITEVVDVSSFSLEYVDRFIYTGDPNSAAASEILEKIVDQIPTEAAQGKELWHLHRGWFEGINDQKMLVNQNLDMQDGQSVANEVIRSLQIFTKTELRFAQPAFDYNVFKPYLDVMHNRSKELFGTLLKEETKKKIGLI